MAVSTDVAALKGARRYPEDNGMDLKDCYEAWIPEPSLYSCPGVKGVVRLTEADCITVRVMTGRTPLRLRLAMVAGVDMVVTISGKQRTEVVVEQALELGLPVHTRCWWRFERVGELRNETASGVLFGLQSGRASLPVLFGGKMLPGVGN
jgi:hypothetical protein